MLLPINTLNGGVRRLRVYAKVKIELLLSMERQSLLLILGVGLGDRCGSTQDPHFIDTGVGGEGVR